MSNYSGTKLALNVMINKEKTKVLFAEANSDFINVLLSFLTLPLGKVAKKGIPLGSITTLYTAIGCLNHTYFCVRGAKQMLLNPESSFRAECRKLALDVTDSAPNQYFLCEDKGCGGSVTMGVNISMYSDIAKCYCGKPLNRGVTVGERPKIIFIYPSYHAKLFSYKHFDPQQSRHTSLGCEEREFQIGMEKALSILKASLTSKTALTDALINPVLKLEHQPKKEG